MMTAQSWSRRAGVGRGFLCALLLAMVVLLEGCATHVDIFRDENMDFGAIRSVAVMPFANLSKDQLAGERVRDVFSTMLLATGAIYAIPSGEVARGIISAGIANPTAPTPEEVVKLAKMIKVDAVIVGTLREYGDVRSGTATADVISLSMQMLEGQTGRIVWSANTTQGGISVTDRLFGGGGRPINDVTEKAVNELITKLFG